MCPHVNRRTILKGLGAGVAGLSVAIPAAAAVDSRYLVTTRGKGVTKRIRKNGFTITQELTDGRVLLVAGDGDQADLNEVDGVETVAADRRLDWRQSPDLTPGAEALTAAGNPPPEDANLRSRQWDKDVTDVPRAHETTTGEGTAIAIVDSGIDADHPDLGPTVDTTAGRRFRRGTVSSGVGTVTRPANFFDLCAGTQTVSSHVTDDYWFHGTWVAAVAGASQGDGGLLGTAPDTRLIPLKALWWDETSYDCDGDGEQEAVATVSTTLGDILAAVDYAAGLGVDAINLSLGTGPLPPEANRSAIRAAYERVLAHATRQGAVVVASAGNSGASLQQGGFFHVPSSTAGAMSISATGPNDRATFYTNYGTNEVAVGAPGGGYETLEKTFCTGDGDLFVPPFTPYERCDPDEEDCSCTPAAYPHPYNGVLSAIPGDSFLGRLVGGRYYFSGGTSAAAPQVAGTAALVRGVDDGVTPRQIEQAIKQGADGASGRSDPSLGAGRVNVADALEAPFVDD